MLGETQFLELAEAELERIEERIEAERDDIDCLRAGNVLRIVPDDGPEVVVNIQTPMREIWLASHRGGYHFGLEGAAWIERRTGETLEARLEEALRG